MDVPLFAALAKAAERCMGVSNPQDLANTAWAFVSAGQSDVLMSASLAKAAERRLGNFKPQELANTAWAFGSVD